MKPLALLCSIFLFQLILSAQNVTINVDAGTKLFQVSPYIYGRNGNFADDNSTAASSANVTRYKEAGLRFARENSGNNATKYNWHKKLSSHPDWYNNVYRHNWDSEAQFIQSNFPNMQIMYAFQLIGKVAANNNHNFNDWDYNSSQWWDGVSQNLAGGGVVNPAGGSDALIEGDPDLYLMDWPADSTTEILNHWFSSEGLGLNKNNFLYWNMDNEPEIWSGTHDDVMPTQPTADTFMEMYFDVAVKAKQKYPGIKLCGPVIANEWQWFRYASQTLTIDGQNYCWLEYFIKKAADKEKATGIRVLDVVDIHFYPYETASNDVLQLHRVFYDDTYIYPGANGVKTINGGWDTSQQKEYIFKRINNWLIKHFGANHGIGIGMSEFGTQSSDPNINAVLYASLLGTFANNGVELFSPWSWKNGMWEVLHLYCRYAKTTSVKTTSNLEEMVSGYSTINENGDSLTLVLVNRDQSSSRNVSVSLSNFSTSNGNYPALQLSSLPTTETFNSHTSNALKKSTVTVSNNALSINLPALSTTAILLSGTNTGTESELTNNSLQVYPNPVQNVLNLAWEQESYSSSIISIYTLAGKQLETYTLISGESSLTINTRNYSEGIYLLELKTNQYTTKQKFVVLK